MIRQALYGVFLLSFAACPAIGQNIPQGLPRNPTNFDTMIQLNGVADLKTLEELDRTRHEQVSTRSEATVSKLDLKAPGKAQREYAKGLRFLTGDDFKSAVESLQKATSIYPEYVSAHNALGCAYFNLHQADLARGEFKRAIQLDDHLSNSYLNLGRAEMELGDGAAAQVAMEKASAIAPLDNNLMMALTYVQFLNHDYTAAIKSAEQVHSRKHEGMAMVHYFAAASWQAQNNLPQTQRELQTFLTEDPKAPTADQAGRILQQIAIEQAQPPEQPLPLVASADIAMTPASSGLKVLQDFRGKQQVADAEKEELTCPTCGPQELEPKGGTIQRPGLNTVIPETTAWTLRSMVDEVALFFTVANHGKPVSDLTQREVTIRDDNKAPASIRGFRSESELPLRLGLIVDTSASVTDRFGFEQGAAINFLQHILIRNNDLAFVAGFSNSLVLVQDFTNDRSRIAHGINELVPIGGTAIWDAVTFAADKLADKEEAKPVARILVVISDGDDNSSSATLKQAIERAERDEVIVYTVSTREALSNAPDDSIGNHAMKLLAEQTGGTAFFPGSTGHLNRSLAELRQIIRSRYLISYRPADFNHDGHYRAIEISAERSGHKLRVNARKGYYTDTTQAESSNRF